MFRGNREENCYFVMKEDATEQFYKKIVQLRGAFNRKLHSNGTYYGIKVVGNGEIWVIYREMICVTLCEEDDNKLYFIDENRDVEAWLFELCKRHLSGGEINIATSDFDEVIHYGGYCHS